jgi:hypothetical protein
MVQQEQAGHRRASHQKSQEFDPARGGGGWHRADAGVSRLRLKVWGAHRTSCLLSSRHGHADAMSGQSKHRWSVHGGCNARPQPRDVAWRSASTTAGWNRDRRGGSGFAVATGRLYSQRHGYNRAQHVLPSVSLVLLVLLVLNSTRAMDTRGPGPPGVICVTLNRQPSASEREPALESEPHVMSRHGIGGRVPSTLACVMWFALKQD